MDRSSDARNRHHQAWHDSVEDPNARSEEVSMEKNPDDVIVKVSEPFLEYSFVD
jgi:hypothetical protein